MLLECESKIAFPIIPLSSKSEEGVIYEARKIAYFDNQCGFIEHQVCAI
jgi:hypothetical protein